MTGSGAASLAAIAGRPPDDRRTTAGRPPVDRFRPAAGAMSEGCPQDVRRTSTGQKREDQDRARPRSDLPAVASRIRRRQQPARVLPGSCSRCGAGEPGIRAASGSGAGLFRLYSRADCREIFRRPREALRSPADARSGPGWTSGTGGRRKDPGETKRPARRISRRIYQRGKAKGCSSASCRPADPLGVRRMSAGRPRDVLGQRRDPSAKNT